MPRKKSPAHQPDRRERAAQKLRKGLEFVGRFMRKVETGEHIKVGEYTRFVTFFRFGSTIDLQLATLRMILRHPQYPALGTRERQEANEWAWEALAQHEDGAYVERLTVPWREANIHPEETAPVAGGERIGTHLPVLCDAGKTLRLYDLGYSPQRVADVLQTTRKTVYGRLRRATVIRAVALHRETRRLLAERPQEARR